MSTLGTILLILLLIFIIVALSPTFMDKDTVEKISSRINKDHVDSIVAKIKSNEQECIEACELLRDRSYDEVCSIPFCRTIAIPEYCS